MRGTASVPYHRAMESWIDGARDELSERITGESWFEVRRAVLHGKIVGEPNVVVVHDRLAHLFDCDSATVLGMLGISRSHKSRAHLSVDMLDRVACVLDAYSRVDRLLGPSHARHFFQHRDDRFGLLRGTDLLRTRVGTQFLGWYITSREYGAFR